jgi:small subunit ribosomal protein S1
VPRDGSIAGGDASGTSTSAGAAEAAAAIAPPATIAPLADSVERAKSSSTDEGRGARSRTDTRGKREGRSEPPTTESLRVNLPPKPSRRDKLSDDLQMEMDAAFGDRSLDELISGTAPAAISQIPEPESRHRAQVIRVYGDNVFFSLTGRCEGVVSLRQFATPPNPGDTFDVVVRGFNQEDGLCELVVPGASVEVSDWSDLTEGALVEATVTASNSGGLECEVNRIRGFIPASQTGLYRVENLGDFVGQKLLCVVTEANAQRRNLVLSHRAVLERQKQESRQNFYNELEVGQVREGIVRKIQDFGAFVDLGGADGLIHVSQLSWERVKHPSEVVQEGQKVQVRIEKIDADTGRIGLSLRSMTDDPWKDVEQRFPVGSMAQGTVSRIANFGAFVKLAAGIEGLIHVTELAHYRVTNIGKVVQEGQEVNVKVLSVDAESQRIGLSLKAATPVPVSESASAADRNEPEVEEPPRALAVAKRSGPLKGGVDRSSRGENFGLKW